MGGAPYSLVADSNKSDLCGRVERDGLTPKSCNRHASPLPTWPSRRLLRGNYAAWLVLLLLSLDRTRFAETVLPTLPVGRIQCLFFPEIRTCLVPPHHFTSARTTYPASIRSRSMRCIVYFPYSTQSRGSPIDPHHLQLIIHHHITLHLRSPHEDGSPSRSVSICSSVKSLPAIDRFRRGCSGCCCRCCSASNFCRIAEICCHCSSV